MRKDSQSPALAAQHIIAKFGGPARMSRVLSDDGDKVAESTVRSWGDSGIPVQWQFTVLQAAKHAAIGLGPEDFFGEQLSEGGEI